MILIALIVPLMDGFKGTWYFNKRLGELKYRLLAIAPVAADISTFSDKTAKADPENFNPLFWVWYPDAEVGEYNCTIEAEN